jgi:hypothetical protein
MTDEMKRFFTRPQANAGTRLVLKDPITGKDTEHWIQVLGQDSDAFREEEDACRRRTQDALAAIPPNQQNDMAKRVEVVRGMKLEEFLLGAAALVAAWSFAEPCTREDVIAWLRQAPHIQTEIDILAGDRANFLGSSASSSTSTPNQSSSSTGSQQEAPQANP